MFNRAQDNLKSLLENLQQGLELIEGVDEVLAFVNEEVPRSRTWGCLGESRIGLNHRTRLSDLINNPYQLRTLANVSGP